MYQKSKLIEYIQYLRAIAVIFVFFYHLEISFFENGFLGVDIFFVISGFVITQMLLDDYYLNLKFDLYNFYIKRFKRIYPVLLFFLIVALLIVILLSPLDLFLGRFHVIFFSLFGLSNFYYMFKASDYFDNIFADPLNHTWSLGVEEQFYLFFPIFLSITFFLFSGKIRKISIVFFLLIFVGIIFTYINQDNLKLVFYSPLFRFWEFLLGGFALLISRVFTKKSAIYSAISFLLIIFIVLSGNTFTNFQKIFFTSSLVALLLFFCDDKYLIRNKISHNCIIYISNISYSFYLWHLLIIYFYKLYLGIGIIDIAVIFLITLVFSSISYKFIEQKFRYIKFKNNFFKNFFYTIVSTFLIFLLCIFFVSKKTSNANQIKLFFKNIIYKSNFLEKKLDFTERTVFYKFNINNNEIYTFCKDDSKKYNISKDGLRAECLKNNSTKRLFFIAGNSHTANFIPMFNSLKNDSNFYYLHTSISNIKKTILELERLMNNYEEVVFTTHVSKIDDLEILFDSLKETKKNIKILILGPIPNVSNTLDPLICLIKQQDCFYSSKDDFESRKLDNLNKAVLDHINTNDNEVFFYKPYKHMCPEDLCYVYNKKIDFLTHRDDSHLTMEGSLSLREHFKIFYKTNFN